MFGGGGAGSVRQSASHEPSMGGGGGGVPNPSYGGSYQMLQQAMPPTMRKR